MSNTQQMKAATQRLFDILCCHLLICGWIIFAQVRLRLVSPVVGIFLMHLVLLCMAERSWRLQAETMHIWHPLVQACFCVTRMIHGAVVLMAVCIWARVLAGAVVV